MTNMDHQQHDTAYLNAATDQLAAAVRDRDSVAAVAVFDRMHADGYGAVADRMLDQLNGRGAARLADHDDTDGA